MELAIVLVVGLACGHLIDIFFDRLYTGAELGGGLYRCSECRSALRPVFAIPLIGTLSRVLRCPDCGELLRWRSLVLPAGSTALFAASYFVFAEVGAGLLGGFFATVFLTLTLTDIERRLIPNRIVYPCLVLAMALSWGWPETSVVEVFAGGAVALAIAACLLLFSLPFGAGAFGMGDVKLIFLTGLVVGFPAAIIAVFAGTLAGGVGAGLLVLFRLRTLRDYIPHGPALAFGAILAQFWGNDIWDWYTNR